ncbi:phage tail protein [Robertmurraya sp. FSL W8-0741]|uniref:phage tail protein n=1 Tax=Robertmurraya sp. FSL W8-0741 TaxID=2954629 RepID=UPI0030F8D10A
MLIVTDLQGNTEALTNIQNAVVNEEVNGDFSISFTSFLSPENAHAYPLLEEESLIELDGHEFRVKKIVEVNKRKQVESALHIFFDLIEHQIYGYMGGTKSADDIFNFILAGSGWTFENVDVTNYVVLSNFGEDNAVKLIRDACNALDCEIKIMPGKHLKLYKRIGTDTDNQFRFRHNVKTLKKSVDTSNLRTVIKGFGSEGLEVTYPSPMVAIYGERHAEPVRDDRYSIPESLLDRLKQELNDVPEISIEIEVTQLDFEANLGDNIWTIYEPLGMDIKTRIAARKWFPFSKRAPTVTIENRKKTFSDILTQQRVEIDQNKKETRSRFEQTNERITMEVERVNESIATLELEADNIKLSVEAMEESVAAVNIRADNIVFSVNQLGNRVGNAESQLSIQAGLISTKVERNGVISAIVQSPETIKLQASRIELSGITNVADTLTIGSGYGSVASIRFNGADSWINTYGSGLQVSTGGNFDVQALNATFYGTTVDLGSANRIIWGNNGPTNVAFASNAGAVNGYSASDLVKDTFSQGLGLYRDSSTGRIVVRQGSSILGALAWN